MNHPVMINGKNYDWTDLSWVIFGVPLIGITEINYDRTRDSPNNYGAGGEPTSYGYKNFEYKGDISVYVDELQAILQNSPNRSIIQIPPFSAQNIFSGDAVLFTTHKLKNIRFTSDPFSAKQNDGALIVKVPFVYAGLAK